VLIEVAALSAAALAALIDVASLLKFAALSDAALAALIEVGALLQIAALSDAATLPAPIEVGALLQIATILKILALFNISVKVAWRRVRGSVRYVRFQIIRCY
jgi:hypothetical protein